MRLLKDLPSIRVGLQLMYRLVRRILQPGPRQMTRRVSSLPIPRAVLNLLRWPKRSQRPGYLKYLRCLLWLQRRVLLKHDLLLKHGPQQPWTVRSHPLWVAYHVPLTGHVLHRWSQHLLHRCLA